MLTSHNRLEDESALQAKVNEAMAVYDDYLKSQGGAKEGDAAGKKDDKVEVKA